MLALALALVLVLVQALVLVLVPALVPALVLVPAPFQRPHLHYHCPRTPQGYVFLPSVQPQVTSDVA